MTVLERIEYFNANTTVYSKYVFPIAFGLMLAAIWPWITFAGSRVVSQGVARTKKFQIEEAHKVQMQRIELRGELQKLQDRMAREKEDSIEQIARQRKQTVAEVGKENFQSVIEEFEQLEVDEKGRTIDTVTQTDLSQINLTGIEEVAIIVLRETAREVTMEDIEFNSQLATRYEPLLNHSEPFRATVEVREALVNLLSYGLVKSSRSGHIKLYGLTTSGYQMFDILHDKYPVFFKSDA